jgi:regulatory protein
MTRRRAGRDVPATPPSGTPRLAALRLLGRRDYSAQELMTRLTDRGYPIADVQAAIEQLTTDRAIDDRRTAFAHVRQAARIKGRGTHRIRRELEARGIPAAIVRDALEQLSPDDDAAAIKRFLARKHRPGPLDPAERRRLFQQLLRRGFPAALIGRTLNFDLPDE